MIFAVFRAALLSLVADAGAVVMGFVVPVVFFLVFAAIFSSSSGGAVRLKLAVADEVQTPASRAFVGTLVRDPAIRLVSGEWDRAGVRDLVRHGTADVGLVVRKDGEPLDDVQGLAAPPLLIVVDPSRAVTGDMLAGQLQRAWLTALPDVALRQAADLIGTEFTSFTPTQDDEIAAGLARLRADAGTNTGQRGFGFDEVMSREAVAGQNAGLNNVAYYAGAVTFLFLLLAAAQASLACWDERENGVLERIVAGPGGLSVALNGRFLFLVAQALAQTVVIFAAAWLVYGVDVPGRLGAWLLVAVASACAAAGLGLGLVVACRSRAEAQVLPTVFILVLSAVGGSMVPRFFMPQWLQDLGWLTPNTWALEAWSGVFWREEPLLALVPLCAMLLAMGAAGLGAAHLLGGRLVRE